MDNIQNALKLAYEDFAKLNYKGCYQIVSSLHTKIGSLAHNLKIKKLSQSDIDYICGIINNYSGISIDLGDRINNIDLIINGINNLNVILEHSEHPTYHYNCANGLQYLLQKKFHNNTPVRSYIDNITDINLVKYHFYKASFPNPNLLNRSFASSVLTNYSTFLYRVCWKPLEANLLLEKAIEYDDSNAVAFRERAYTIIYTAKIVDEEVRGEFLNDGLIDLMHSYNLDDDIDRRAQTLRYIKDTYNHIPEFTPVKCSEDYLSKVSSDYKRNYLIYAKNNDLFLNLFDRDHKCSGAYYDSITITKMYSTKDDFNRPRLYHHYLNVLKHDYAFARLMIFEYVNKCKNINFINKDIRVSDIYSGYAYSIYINFLISSLKNSISIFDKVSYTVNQYLNLGINNNNISIMSYIISKPRLKKHANMIHNYVSNNKILNPYLISVIDSAEDLASIREKDIREIRHSFEHRFGATKIYTSKLDTEVEDLNRDNIHIDRLYEMALKALKKAKSMIYTLVLMINYGENANAQDAIDIYTPTIPIDNLTDRLKGIY